MTLIKYKLSDLCDVQIGRTPPRKEFKWFNSGEKDDFIWVSIKDLGDCYKYINFSAETITKEGQAKFNIPIVKKGTVILSFKLTVGRVAIATNDLLTNEAIAQLPIKRPDLLDRDYLYYYLLQYPWRTLGSTSSIATAINSTMIKDMPVSIPTIDVQKRIVKMLASIDDKIISNFSINSNLEKQICLIFNNKIALFENTPNNWSSAPLDSIANYLNGLAMQKYPKIEGEEYLPVLKIAELKKGCCDSESDMCNVSFPEKYIVNNGDVIFSWSASLFVDIWCGGKAGLNQHLFKVTSDRFDRWFYYCWTQYYLSEFIREASAKATTMGHITRDRLTKAIVLIPDKETYKNVGGVLSKMIDVIVCNRLANNKLIALKEMLAPKLISGEIGTSTIKAEE